LAIAGIILTFIWMAAVLVGALWYAPAAEGLGETGRIIYFHVPLAWIAVLAFCMSMWFSVRALRFRRAEDDIKAEVTARIGWWFCVLATVTGAFFAKAEWNMYWNWDPREISIAILLMVYFAYFGLRAAVPDPERRMRLAAVYAILAFMIMPFLVFVVPRAYASLHPDTLINREGTNQLADPRMRLVFFSSLAGFTFLYLWLYNLSVRIEKVVRRRGGWNV
jgi:heme exporter protein C